MATQPIETERRTEKLDVRVSPTAKAKLQAAASAVHRSMSDFVMESALARAEETLRIGASLGWMRRNGPGFKQRSMRPLVRCPGCKRCSMNRDSSMPARHSDRESEDRKAPARPCDRCLRLRTRDVEHLAP